MDVVGPAGRRRQRRDRLVRRLPERRRARVDRRHHGVPVVHVPAAEPGVEHRQLVLRAAAVAGGDGARVRGAGDGGRQARPARRARRAAVVRRDPLRGRRVRVPRGPAGGARLQRHRARRLGGRAGRPQRRRQDDGDRPRGAVPRSDARAHPAQRRRHPRLPAAHVPRPARHRAAGRVPVRRLGARQHRLRPARRDRRRGRGRRPPRQRARVHRQAARAATRRSSASAA